MVMTLRTPQVGPFNVVRAKSDPHGYLDDALRLMVRPLHAEYAAWRFQSYAELTLALGSVYEGSPLPDRLKLGPPDTAVANALALVDEYPHHLLYVEGYALHPEAPQPILHAWTVTPKGRVVDPTWLVSSQCVYRGLSFALADVERFETLRPEDCSEIPLLGWRPETAGIIRSDWLLGYPLLRTGRLFPTEAPAP